MTQNDSLKSLFILGAGASVDHGYPTGECLLNDILNLLGNKTSFQPYKGWSDNLIVLTILRVLQKIYNGEILDTDSYDTILGTEFRPIYLELEQFYKKLEYSYTRSIDDFIHSQTSNEADKNKIETRKDIGKLLIVIILLRYEKESMHFNKEDGKFKHRSTFYTDLWQSLYGLKFEDFKDNLSKIQFVSFNYDRLLESFLYTSASHFYNLDQGVIRDAIKENLVIHHVYGRLSELDWESTNSEVEYGFVDNEGLGIIDVIFNQIKKVLEACKVPKEILKARQVPDLTHYRFKHAIKKLIGSKTSPDPKCLKFWVFLEFLFNSADGIKTYTEILDTKKDPIKHKIERSIERMYFLGFSFHDLNIEALKKILNFKSSYPPETYSSSYKMKSGEVHRAHDKLHKIWFTECHTRNKINRNNGKKGKNPPYHDLLIPELFKADSDFRYI